MPVIMRGYNLSVYTRVQNSISTTAYLLHALGINKDLEYQTRIVR